jgi:hypothetical protein
MKIRVNEAHISDWLEEIVDNASRSMHSRKFSAQTRPGVKGGFDAASDVFPVVVLDIFNE